VTGLGGAGEGWGSAVMHEMMPVNSHVLDEEGNTPTAARLIKKLGSLLPPVAPELKQYRPQSRRSQQRPSNRGLRASLPMEPSVQPNGHVCTTCGAVTGSPNAELKLSRSRLKLGLVSTSLAVGLFCGTPVFPQMHYRESP